MNKEFIARNLCVKKAVKGNCCKGSCHLAKELKENEKKEQTPGALSLKDKNDTQLFFGSFSTLDLTTTFSELNNFAPYQELELFSFSGSIFHPPCIA